MELTDLQFAVAQQNKINELQEGISNICIAIHKPENTFIEMENDDIRFIMESIIRMKKELKELREFKDNVTGLIVKE